MSRPPLEDLVRFARVAASGINRPADLEDPMRFDPPEWVLDAIAAAYEAGERKERAGFQELLGRAHAAVSDQATMTKVLIEDRTGRRRKPRR